MDKWHFVALVSHGWTIYRATELFLISMFSKLPTYKAEFMTFLDALSLFCLGRIPTDESSELILKHFNTDEFVKHDYSDCLGPDYTIPSLIASLLKACSITADKISYKLRSDDKGNTDERKLGLMIYVPPLVITRIVYQCQTRAYITFMLLLRALSSLQFILILSF